MGNFCGLSGLIGKYKIFQRNIIIAMMPLYNIARDWPHKTTTQLQMFLEFSSTTVELFHLEQFAIHGIHSSYKNSHLLHSYIATYS